MTELEILVPDARSVLLLHDGVPEGLLRAGRHRVASGPGRLEVRSLDAQRQARAPRGLDEAARLPFDCSELYVDGGLVAVLRPARFEASPLSAWTPSTWTSSPARPR